MNYLLKPATIFPRTYYIIFITAVNLLKYSIGIADAVMQCASSSGKLVINK